MARASLETQQAVYLALRGVFTGEVARLREKKAIRRIVKAHEGDIDLLVKKYTLEGVVGVARSLVLEEVFESELKAKERFPTAFKDAVVSHADEAPEQAGTMSEHEVSDKAHTCRRCGSSDTVIIADSIGLQEGQISILPVLIACIADISQWTTRLGTPRLDHPKELLPTSGCSRYSCLSKLNIRSLTSFRGRWSAYASHTDNDFYPDY